MSYSNPYFSMAEWRVLELQQNYPALNVIGELDRMRIWLDANPRKAKKKLWMKFIVGWLNRAHAQVTVAAVNARCYARAGTYDPQRPVPDYSAECEEILRRYPDLA